MNVRRLFLLLAALALAGAAPAGAQRARVHETPPRPAMWAGADTNSAVSYYTHGLSLLERSPAEAAAAFYWAARLRPGWADPLYARRIALLMSDRHRLVDYMNGRRNVRRNPEVLAIDSLQLRALSLDPFLFQKLDRHMVVRYLEEVFADELRDSQGNRDESLARFEVQRFLDRASPSMRAWMAYSEGRFPAAIEGYERELRGARNKSRVRADVARVHFLSGNLPQAAEHMRKAIEEMREDDDREMVFVYESKALLEHSLATVHRRTGNRDAAREAYGRALQEDLSFYPAHVFLSEMALEAGDTATALSEMALAVEIAPGEPSLRHAHAVLLLRARRPIEAAAELEKAIELEPYYAAPRFLLAALNDASGVSDAARTHYRAFLERAPRDDPQRPRATGRLAELDAAARTAAAANPQ